MAFGEMVEGYDVPVLNEREARAGAGILFLVALVAFMHAWLEGNFTLVRMVVVGFFLDFVLRVLVSPRLAPSLIVGRFFVRNQKPELVGAAQKRFAWALGLALATAMMVLFVVMGIRGPITMLICVLCLLLLFFETAFGICLGCLMWNAFMKTPPELCPGGVCEVRERTAIQQVSALQGGALAAFVAVMIATPAATRHLAALRGPAPAPSAEAEAERCKVPAFAKAMGHEDMWKKHNGCP